MSDRNTVDVPDDNPAARALDVGVLTPLSLDDALSLVGEGTRAGIIRALGDAREADRVAPRSLSFSELMERTNVEDSGHFNYHLGELVGTFVEEREGGYVLTHPGQLVYEAFVAGTLTDRPTVEPFDVDACPNCDGRLRGAYRSDHLLVVACPDCGTLFDAAHFPPRGVEARDRTALLDAAYRYRYAQVGAMRRGVCPRCGGAVERSCREDPPPSLADQCVCDAVAVLACTACHRTVAGNPVLVALTTPTVTGLFSQRDLDPARERWWDDPVASARRSVETCPGTDGVATLRFDFDTATHRVTLDDELQVVSATQVRSPQS